MSAADKSDNGDKTVSSAILMNEIQESLLEAPVFAKLKRVKTKPKQLKLKQYLARKKRNWQNYPDKDCVFSTSLNKKMYDPPKYKKEFCELELTHASFCGHCGLRPCLAQGKELMILNSLKSAHQHPPLAIQKALQASLDHMDETCGVLHAKRMQFSKSRIPLCLRVNMAEKMDQAVAEVQDQLKRDHQKPEDGVPDYLRNTEYHHHSLKLALAEMRGDMTEDQVYESAIKFETPQDWGSFEY